MVIAYDFWQTRFGGRPDVIGREIRLNGHVFTIVGVAPAGFPGPQLGASRQIYVPMMMQAVMRPPRARYSGEQNPDLLQHPTNSWIFGVGRLKPAAPPSARRAELDAGARRLLPHARAAPRRGPRRRASPPVRSTTRTLGPRPQLRSAALLLAVPSAASC